MPTVDDLLRRFNVLKEYRYNWDSHWDEVARLVWPSEANFITQHTPGEKRSQEIYDATAALALEKFAAALESMLTPRQQRWHTLKSSNEALNEEPGVAEWFETATDTLFRMRNHPSAGFYSQKHEGYKSLGAFGNECLFVDEARDWYGVSYQQCSTSQVYIEVNPHRRVDTVFRCYRMTAKAAAQKWEGVEGAELPPKVRAAIENPGTPYKEFEFLHVVTPRRDADPERKDAKGMPFASYHIGLDDKEIISEGGYEEFPYLYSRYTVNSSEIYGRGPAMLLLPSIKGVQEMQKTMIEAGHKVVDPPLLAYDDGELGDGASTINLRPRAINRGYVTPDGRPRILPLVSGGRLDINEALIQNERQTINDGFLVSLFQILVETPNMTATEALMRAQEKGQLLAPTVGRQQSESLGPLITRELNIAFRLGLLPEIPPVLLEAEDDYDIVYESPAMRMQRSEELQGIQETVATALSFAQFDPNILQLLDMEEVVRETQEIRGAPSNILRTKDEYEQIRAAQAQQAQQEAQMQQVERAAPVVKDLAAAGQQGGVSA